MIQHFFFHTDAVIFNFDQNCVQSFDISYGNNYSSFSVGRNGLMRVNQQIGDYLLDFLKMSLNGWQTAVYIKVDAGNSFANLSAYNTSKAALVALIRTAALENADAGITANTILPGTMNTEANRRASPDADPSKWVQTERVADIAVFLVSDAGAEITGAAIPAYGLDI